MLILRIKSGPEKGQSYSITEKPLVIGRDTADGGIQIFDQGASRQHAQVYKLGNMHFVKDLASRNGTFVNDDRITEEMLQVGDKIRIGHTIFVVDEATMKKATRPDEIEYLIEDDFSHHTIELNLKEAMEQAAREKSERTDKSNGKDGDNRRERVEGSQTLKSLYRVTQLIAQTPGEAVLCPALADVCAMILNANLVYVLLRDPITDRLTKRGMYKHEVEGDGGVSRSIIKTVLSKRKPLMTADAGADDRFRSERSVVLSKIEAVIGVPILAREQVFGVIYIAHPKNGQQFRNEDLELATVVGIQLGLALENERAVAEVRSGLADTIRALVRIGEMAQPTRAGHSERVARLAAALADQLGFDETEGYWCVIAALLHDVGRVVDPSPRTVRDGHAHGQPETSIQRGLAVLETIHGIGPALPGIRHQYERWDGTGWPDSLGGEDIPRIARVLAVANAFDSASHYALSEHDQPLSREEAVEMVTGKAGKEFDAEVCDALAALASEQRLEATPAFLTSLFPSLNDADAE